MDPKVDFAHIWPWPPNWRITVHKLMDLLLLGKAYKQWGWKFHGTVYGSLRSQNCRSVMLCSGLGLEAPQGHFLWSWSWDLSSCLHQCCIAGAVERISTALIVEMNTKHSSATRRLCFFKDRIQHFLDTLRMITGKNNTLRMKPVFVHENLNIKIHDKKR